MASIKPVRLRLSAKLKDWNYFHKFFDERARDELASQLRSLRIERRLTQAQFAKKAGMRQSAVSRIEQADYSGWTYKTLLKAASALRARVKIELVPQEAVVEQYEASEAMRRTSELVHQLTNVPASGVETSADRIEAGPHSAGNYVPPVVLDLTTKPVLHSNEGVRP